MIPAEHEGDDRPQTLTWNLVFAPSGDAKPEIAFWLAEEHGLFVTRDEKLLDAGVETEEGEQLEVVLLKPGEILPGRICEALSDVAAMYVGCAEGGISLGSMGYPPLPYALWDDQRKPDEHIPTRYLGHPVFWLPEAVLRGPTPYQESVTVRDTRIAMELVARGVMNPETGDVVDVLVANGLDYRDPSVGEMLEAWRAGENVPELDELILPDPTDLVSAPGGTLWASIAATKLVRESWSNIELVELADLNGQVLRSCEIIELSTADLALAGFEAAGKTWMRSPRSKKDNEALSQSVEDFTDRLSEVMLQNWLPLVLTMRYRKEQLFGDRWDQEQADRHQHELDGRINTDIYAFHEQAEALLDALFEAKPAEAESKLTETWNHLAAMWLRWVSGESSPCREAVNSWVEAGPIDISEYSEGSPPEAPSQAVALPASTS